MEFKGKTVFLTGGSRGIGKAIGVRLAKEGANVVIAAKTAAPHPKLPGTIYTAAEEMEAAGGKALPLIVDIRYEEQVRAAVEASVEHFGGIDILVNNASAISLTNTKTVTMKRYDLMHSVNVRGTFLASKLCIPYLRKAENPHVLNLSPPLNMDPKWFANHVAYTMTKYGMSMCVLGMHEEYRHEGIAFNALWPRTTIATVAVRNMPNGEQMCAMSRKPEIMADAAYHILRRDSRACTGHFFIDDEVLFEEGYSEKDLECYAEVQGNPLLPDFFI
jgi:citronellol/citronellal dehydrogenase